MATSTSIAEHRKLAVTLGTYGHADHRSIHVSHGSLNAAVTLTFERTLRVPDNADVNNLPPSLGQFPLFSVAEYKDRMPDDMAKKGGVFLPMYQREAMWINFSAKEPFALKIYVGGVNAISGVSVNEKPEAMLKRLQVSDKVKQDYVVLPEQPWLDGIASEDGRIRQFVAMPKGSGYSVEAQVTGEEKIGGLQFELTPVKRGCPENLTVKLCKGELTTTTLNLKENGLSDMSTMMDLKKLIQKEFNFPIQDQDLCIERLQNSPLSPSIYDDNLTFSEIWIPGYYVLEVHTSSPPVHSRVAGRGGIGFARGGKGFAPSMLAKKAASPPGGPAALGLMSKDSVESVSRRSRARDQAKEKSQAESQVKAMSLAAGGLIKQSINPDRYPPSIWDRDSSILFNVQLLNSEAFTAVTGCAPPSTPVDAKTYAQYGMPFYDIWNEELSGVKGDFSGVKSVGEMDEALAVADKGTFWGTMMGAGGDEVDSGQDKKGEGFKRDESILFPVIMLDMRQKTTFRPLSEMEEEARKMKAAG